jgi:hypothetical protein
VSEQCPWCLRSDQAMTREHIFARWLVRRVHGAQLIPSSATAAERIARVTAGVCADCNAGWMSVLEDSFRRAVYGRPRVGTLQAQDRVILSRWFTKTAVLLGHARGSAFVGPAGRERLVAGMPDDVEVFLARRRRPPQRLDFSFGTAGDREPAAVRSVAVQVDDLVAHVAPRGVLASRHGTQLWPLRSHLIRWETLPVIAAPHRSRSRSA